MWSRYFEQFARSPLLVFPVLSLLLFLGLFAAVLFYVAVRGRPLESRASLPLEGEDHG